jgi:hypothetical protein
MSKLTKLVSMLAIVVTSSVSAVPLIEGATVEKVQLTWYGSELIVLALSGGSGLCVGQNIVLAKANYANWEGHFDRSYSMLMTAMVAGKSVDIHGMEEKCTNGSLVFINN